MAEIQQQGSSSKVRYRRISTHIDFTPMVDLGFLLITFFILTTTMSKPRTMEINMPAKPEPNEPAGLVKASKVLTLLLSKDNRIVYYKGVESNNPTVEFTTFAPNGVRKIILEHLADVEARFEKDEPIVIIKPDDDSCYKNVIDALDEMNINDIQRYFLSPITPEEKDMLQKAWERAKS